MLNWVQVGTHRGPGHHPDVVLLSEGKADPGSVVLLQGEVGVLLEVGHDFRRQNLVDVPVYIHAVSTP